MTIPFGPPGSLGAARGDVTGLVLRQGSAMVATGVGLGLVGTLLITRVLRTLRSE